MCEKLLEFFVTGLSASIGSWVLYYLSKKNEEKNKYNEAVKLIILNAKKYHIDLVDNIQRTQAFYYTGDKKDLISKILLGNSVIELKYNESLLLLDIYFDKKPQLEKLKEIFKKIQNEYTKAITHNLGYDNTEIFLESMINKRKDLEKIIEDFEEKMLSFIKK